MLVTHFQDQFGAVRAQLARVVVGQATALEHLLVAIFADGHAMLTGMPGLGRTLLVKSLARVLGLSFRRIQFTPDLLPTDITGTEILQESPDRKTRSFRFFQGPVFGNLILADEINRTPPRTQSALLEVMQERQVTVGGQRHAVPVPFFLVATQNSLETEGIFPLPEAQMDRFLMSIRLDYPSFAEEVAIIDATTEPPGSPLQQILNPEQVLEMQHFAQLIPVTPSVKEYALALVRNTRPDSSDNSVSRLLRWGASVRGGQALLASAKVLACSRGRPYVTRQDIREVALPVLAHRLILSFRAGAQGTRLRDLIAQLTAETDRQLAPPIKSRRWRDILLCR